MPTIDPCSLDGFVVAAGLVGYAALFALGDGSVIVRDRGESRRVAAHDGGILAAQISADGKAMLSAGDDGRVVRTTPDGKIEVLFEKPGKWLDQLAEGPQGAIACAAGRMAGLSKKAATA